jgi:tight adherence protein B
VETTLSIVILALLMTLALMFYERSRRAEAARRELLAGRVQGDLASRQQRAALEPGVDQSQRPVARQAEAFQSVQRWLAQAGIEIPAAQFVVLTMLIAVAGTLLSALWFDAGIAGVYGIGFATLPAAYVFVERKRRLATFSQQLPYVLDFLRSALRAGHTLARALRMSAENAPDPIATELRLAIDQMRYGATLPDALESMFKRVPEESLGFFVAAVRVQAEVGSGIAEILDRVAAAIRDRQRLQQQLKTLTAQARMSGLIVGALPFVLLVLFSLIRPDYIGLLFHDQLGIKMLEAAIILDTIAFILIRRMLRVA